MPSTSLHDFAAAQQARLIGILTDADPLSEDYRRGLDSLNILGWMQGMPSPEPGVMCASDANCAPLPTPVSTPVDEPEDTPPWEENEPNQDDPAVEHPHYTKEFVRQSLADARVSNKIDITPIFEKLGYARFSEVPEEKYWLVMSELGVLLNAEQGGK